MKIFHKLHVNSFFACIPTFYFAIYWIKSCLWQTIFVMNVKITYNAIHQGHLMTGLREKYPRLRGSREPHKKFSQWNKSWFTVCHYQFPIAIFFTMLLMSNFIFYSCLFLRLEEVIHEGVNQSQSYCIHHYIEHLV